MRTLFFVSTISVMLLCTSPSFAAIIWESGFETSPDDDWYDTYTQGTGCLVDYRAEAAHSGGMGSYHYVPSTAEDDSIARGRAFNGTSYSERHARFWVNMNGFFLPETYPMRAITPIMRDAGAYVEVLLRRDGDDYQFRLRIKTPPMGYIESDPVVMDKTEWHQVDLYVKDESSPGAGDGIVRWWVDGIEEYTKTDAGPLGPTDSWVFGISGPAGGALNEYGYMYVDDVTIWDTLTPPLQRTLTVSSTAGGSVTDPGEGAFTYGDGMIVPLAAESESGYYFSGWTGTAVDAGKVADPGNSTSSVTVDADYTVTANFTLIDSDGDGLEDAWEQQIIDADPNDDITSIEDVLPGDDFDGDGNSNETEETAGTDPTDENSFFAIVQVDKSLLPLEVTITWTSVTGRFYAFYYSNDEPGTSAVWVLAEDMIPASGSGTNAWTDDGTLSTPAPDDAGLLHRIYRVLVYPE